MDTPTKEACVADVRTYRCRFFPSSDRNAKARSLGAELKTYRVPVMWWSYADDRLDARCPAVKTEAVVEVKAYDPKEARQLVFREWGDHGTVGWPDPSKDRFRIFWQGDM